uniref:Uncharacterized protein n=1 Tax=Lygus hesperus TaxID=30085 RepID=A0A0A9XJ23_LYGHE
MLQITNKYRTKNANAVNSRAKHITADEVQYVYESQDIDDNVFGKVNDKSDNHQTLGIGFTSPLNIQMVSQENSGRIVGTAPQSPLADMNKDVFINDTGIVSSMVPKDTNATTTMPITLNDVNTTKTPILVDNFPINVLNDLKIGLNAASSKSEVHRISRQTASSNADVSIHKLTTSPSLSVRIPSIGNTNSTYKDDYTQRICSRLNLEDRDPSCIAEDIWQFGNYNNTYMDDFNFDINGFMLDEDEVNDIVEYDENDSQILDGYYNEDGSEDENENENKIDINTLVDKVMMNCNTSKEEGEKSENSDRDDDKDDK